MFLSIALSKSRNASRIALAGLVLFGCMGVQPSLAQDSERLAEINDLMQKISSGADPCQYLPRMKALIKEMAAETPEYMEAMRPIIAQMDATDDGCDSHKNAAPAPAPKAPPAEPPDSQAVLRQMNQSRTSLRGVNRLALPAGELIKQPSGTFSLQASGQRQFTLGKTGTVTSIRTPVGSARFRANGKVASVQTPSVSVWQGPRGERFSVTRRPDRSVVVTTGRDSGYLEETLKRNRRDYLLRTYVSSGKQTARLFVQSTVAGRSLPVYVSRTSYAPAFYDWVNDSWGISVPYSWPWLANQAFQSLATYFTPGQNYTNPIQWLTDFVLSKALTGAPPDAETNQAQSSEQDAGSSLEAATDTPIGTAVKQALADNVRYNLRGEAQTAGSGGNGASGGQVLDRLFVVSVGLEAAAAGGDTCWLGAGDILRLQAQPAAEDENAQVSVASSRRADCSAGTIVQVSVGDLNEMQNAMRAALDEGLATLRASQGKAGWPAAPPAALAPPRANVDADPDPAAAGLLSSARQESASAAENFVQAAFAPQ